MYHDFRTERRIIQPSNHQPVLILLTGIMIPNAVTFLLPSSCIPFMNFRFIVPMPFVALFINMLRLHLHIRILRHHILKLRPQRFNRTKLITNLHTTSVIPSHSLLLHLYQRALTAITPSIDRFNLLIFANTCSKLCQSSARPHPNSPLQTEHTTPISLRSTSRCCSKYDFSAGCAFVEDEAGGRVVLDDILGAYLWGWL
jgi:hypothetical protein